MEITFTRSTLEDAPALLEAQIRAFHHDAVMYPGVVPGGPPGYDSRQELEMDLQKYPYYTIRVDGEIVGGLVLFDRGGGHLHLDRIYIVPEYHNRGIGTKAMIFMEHTHPAGKWSLHTPAYAVRNQHFYEKFGYVRMGEEHDGDVQLIYYEKLT